MVPHAVVPESTDSDLVRAARDGSEAAFAEIVSRYQGPLRAHCRRILDPAAAEDAVQQAFLKAFLSLGTAPGGDVLLRPWLYKIAQNCAIDMRRAGSPTEELELVHDTAGDNDHPAASYEGRERMRDIMRCLSALPTDQRRALVAREMEGRSYEEISAELGQTEGGVRQLIFRARSTMRRVAAPSSEVTAASFGA